MRMAISIILLKVKQLLTSPLEVQTVLGEAVPVAQITYDIYQRFVPHHIKRIAIGIRLVLSQTDFTLPRPHLPVPNADMKQAHAIYLSILVLKTVFSVD